MRGSSSGQATERNSSASGGSLPLDKKRERKTPSERGRTRREARRGKKMLRTRKGERSRRSMRFMSPALPGNKAAPDKREKAGELS